MGKKTGPKAPTKPIDWKFLDENAMTKRRLDWIAHRMLQKEGVPVTDDGKYAKAMTALQARIVRQLKRRFGNAMNYVEYCSFLRQPLGAGIEGKMVELAMKGNVHMLKILGEQELGHSQKVEKTIKSDPDPNAKPMTVVFKVAERKNPGSRYE